jgi:DNA-binding transcriptional MocR family regulator
MTGTEEFGKSECPESSPEQKLEDRKKLGISLDMTRGKPSPGQLDLAHEMLSLPGDVGHLSPTGIDCRNYGYLDGLPEVKELFSSYLGVPSDSIVLGGNSSLSLMYNAMSCAVLHGVSQSRAPWHVKKIKFLCPVPGYDRHFSVCESLGIEMLPVPMTEEGPDMDRVEEMVSRDTQIKGIWCVPRYSNPTGVTYTEKTVTRLAEMDTAADDFRIFWDNAYPVHHFRGELAPLKCVLLSCREAGYPNRPFIFSSTSKMTFAGSGLSLFAGSPDNIKWYLSHMEKRTIGYDKLNQLRHLLFFRDSKGIIEHMRRHAELLRPKFDLVDEILNDELGQGVLASWTRPHGGYFVSLNTLDGCAKAVVALAAESGVRLTRAGATFPYGLDPRDRNIRIAPSYPNIAEIRQATEILTLCIQVVSRRRGM